MQPVQGPGGYESVGMAASRGSMEAVASRTKTISEGVKTARNLPDKAARIAGGVAMMPLDYLGGAVSGALGNIAQSIPGSKQAGEFISNNIVHPYQKAVNTLGNLLPGNEENYRTANAIIEPVASYAMPGPLKGGTQKLGDLALGPKAATSAADITTEKVIGTTLSKAERAAPIGSAPAHGFWASVDRVLAKIPGVESVYAGKQAAKEAGFKASSEKTFGGNAGQDEAFKQSLAADIENRQKTFNDMYSMLSEQGKAQYIDGSQAAAKAVDKISKTPDLRIFDKSGNVMPGVKSIPQQSVDRIKGYLSDLKNIKQDITTNTPSKVGENYSSWSVLRKNVGGEIGRIRSEIQSPMSTSNKSQLRSELQAYNSIYSEMKAAEKAHMKQVGGDKLVSTWQDVNDIFSEDKPITDTIKKLSGFGREAGEQGSVSAEKTMKRLLTPDEFPRLEKAMSLMSDETRGALRGSLLAKIYDNATERIVVNGQETASRISVPKLQNQYQAYGKDMLEKVIGKEATRQYEDILTAANRAKMKQVSLFDTSNPSQSGYGAMVAQMIGSLITGAGISAAAHSATAGVGTALGFLLLGMPLGRAMARASLNLDALGAIGKAVIPTAKGAAAAVAPSAIKQTSRKLSDLGNQ
jgi:hypothetical protein